MTENIKAIIYFLACVIFLTLGLYSTAALTGIAIGTISAFMKSRQK